MNIFVQLTVAGNDTDNFSLYSNVDNFSVPFAQDIPRETLIAGLVFSAPDYTTQIKIESNSECTNSIFVVLSGEVMPPPSSSSTTSTTTTRISTTSTTTTRRSTTTTTTTNVVAPPAICHNFLLTSDELIDSTFDVVYCDGQEENITVSANHTEIVCARNVLNPLGGSAFIEEQEVCGLTTTTTTTTRILDPLCFNWKLTADVEIDTDFEVTYCDDSVETITVPSNHVEYLCAHNIGNPVGGNGIVQKLENCIE